jgi:hypothetical protein
VKRRGWSCVALLLVAIPTGARAQGSSALPIRANHTMIRSAIVDSPPDRGEATDADSSERRADNLVRRAIDRLPFEAAPLASLIVPGLGQARLRQGRTAAYMAVEAFFLMRYGKDLSEAHRDARDYRDIARTIARRGFAASPPDTAWQYYEKLTEFIESGAFTLAATGPVLPETDTLTYNGAQWLLARRQYGVSPDPGEVGSAAYARALELYLSRAVRQPYRWSWRNAQLEKDLYVRTISRTNDAYRRATIDLSAVIANHLLSAIDAFATVRLTQLPSGALRVSATIPVR